MEHEVVVPPPHFTILLGGVEFEVGKNAFMSEAEGKAQSRDGGAHTRVHNEEATLQAVPFTVPLVRWVPSGWAPWVLSSVMCRVLFLCF